MTQSAIRHVAFLADRFKDRALRAAGYEVPRFTWAEVVHRPATVAAEVRAALARRLAAQRRSSRST